MLGFNKKVRNEIKLISIHIPKTAGTSFRNVLKSAYGRTSAVRFDIKKQGRKEKVIFVENKELKSKKLSQKIKVIHGHFGYKDLVEKLEIKKGIPVITWLRHPVERVISNYFYLAKILREALFKKGKSLYILDVMQKSLIEYARLEENRNRMSKFLEGISLEEMKFVGIQEYLKDDLAYFGQLFEIEDIRPLKQNITDEKHEAGSDLIQEIAAYNATDMYIYKKGIELRKNRLEKNY